jgi:RsiW-degrading membrane proteinase PrsW (M82 family)
VVEPTALAAHVLWRPGAVGGGGGGHLRDPKRESDPTIILLGSFLVPVTFVAYAFGRADQVVTAERILTAFIYGGVLGVLGASLLEAELLSSPSAGTYLYVGLIEEAVKLAALWLLARRLPRYTMRDGIVLGATVGFGFAAFESAGYAFNALFATPVQSQLLQVGQIPAVTQTQVHLFTALYWALLLLDALIGLVVLRAHWHKATIPDRREPATPDRPAVASVSVEEQQ